MSCRRSEPTVADVVRGNSPLLDTCTCEDSTDCIPVAYGNTTVAPSTSSTTLYIQVGSETSSSFGWMQ